MYSYGTGLFTFTNEEDGATQFLSFDLQMLAAYLDSYFSSDTSQSQV